MTTFREEYVDVGGIPTRVISAGTGSRTIVFLHGGMPGITPFCSGSHLWVNAMSLFAQEDTSAVALDFPGHGGSGLPIGILPTIEQQSRHVIAFLERTGSGAAHVVGHSEGGLVALNVAIDRPDLVRSVVVVASGAAAPSGDLVENPTLASPPMPLWSRESQRWALKRLSPFPEPDRSILGACIVASKGEPHQDAVQMATDPMYATSLHVDVLKTKARLFATCRDSRMPVPVQLIWGSHDPLASVEQGLVLYRIIAATQPTSNFHVLAGAGHFVFNDRTQTFHSTVTAFHAALDNGTHGGKLEFVG
jgi:pimeloyl-ACP methyl ester carboxylesterase